MSKLRRQLSANISSSVEPKKLSDIKEKSGNVYESIAVIAKRANQINITIKEELHNKLEEFARSVTEKKIPLIVIISPMYVRSFQENESLIVSKQILAKYGVTVWDYATDPKYVKQELFYDVNHMNAKGAELFSQEIASRMKAEGIIR